MVLEVTTNAREVHNGLDASLAELLRVTNTRALEDQRRAECASADDNLLASTVDLALRVGAIERLGRDGGNTDSPAVLDDDFVHLGTGLQVKVVELGAGAVDIGVGSITATTSVPVDPLEPVLSTMAINLSITLPLNYINQCALPGLQILKVVRNRDALGLRRSQEVLHDRICVVSKGNLDRALKSM